ncbi:Uncharacterised protein [Moraxella lacunata]|uniref:Uncharacterized protein n=1 Tax=Moraxella lacunata TaxID=477 RepID=A0A378QKQ6_MORLA|nr:hypothetical protein [Moraxella lacunata]STZ01445.1 Uncharacterised protein [Moraxella lacunata]
MNTDFLQTDTPIQNPSTTTGRFDDIFGILTATQGATIDEMNETIAQCACEFNEDLED